mmetsp:Transcript_55169/g.126172  ORF Transcript_55169/g.126172 Transcript_55169/m.126172 type:complete len:277 (+) Transcript_55169:117-947(+)
MAAVGAGSSSPTRSLGRSSSRKLPILSGVETDLEEMTLDQVVERGQLETFPRRTAQYGSAAATPELSGGNQPSAHTDIAEDAQGVAALPGDLEIEDLPETASPSKPVGQSTRRPSDAWGSSAPVDTLRPEAKGGAKAAFIAGKPEVKAAGAKPSFLGRIGSMAKGMTSRLLNAVTGEDQDVRVKPACWVNVDKKFKGEWDQLRDRYKDLDFHGIPQDAEEALRQAEIAVSVPFRKLAVPQVHGQRGVALKNFDRIDNGMTKQVEPSWMCGTRPTAR